MKYYETKPDTSENFNLKTGSAQDLQGWHYYDPPMTHITIAVNVVTEEWP